MPISFPYIPSYITVHLGAPSANVENVTVSFIDYLKNVASSEVYPTWDESALQANILAITSFALNRIYTEFYRSRGYNFDITSSTAYDQQFVKGRNFFRPISVLVNQLFDSYLRRRSFIEPLAAKFCNGTTVTCDGLSQWGSQYLAQQGYSATRIIRNYYGNDIEIERNAPMQDPRESYPGTPLRVGSTGPDVLFFQRELNRISQNYPAIPKVAADGIFGPATENAVRTFQQVFGLSVDGIVGRATWYELVRLYVGVKNLAELQSEGLQFEGTSFAYPGLLRRGDSGRNVLQMQYMLAIVGKYIPSVPVIEVDGIFGPLTEDAVRAFQRYNGLEITGVVNAVTWNALYDQFAGIENLDHGQPLGSIAAAAVVAVSRFQPRELLHELGYRGNSMRQEVAAFQRTHGLKQTGAFDQQTEEEARESYLDLSFSQTSGITQFPGTPLELGVRDPRETPESNAPFAGMPVTSLQTMLRTIWQWNQSIPSVIPDGVYGEETQKAVMEFQRQNGLPVTGAADLHTWNKIVSVFQTARVNVSEAAPLQIILNRDQVFLRGCENRHVLLIQAILKILSEEYENMPAVHLTGVYDDSTVDAVKFMQILVGRVPSGIFDKDMWQMCTGMYRACVGNGDTGGN